MTIPIKLAPHVRWAADALRRKSRTDAAFVSSAPNRLLLEQVRILRDVIHPRVLAHEPQLADTRWPQYGYSNAVEATQEFTKAYVEAYAYYRRKYVDSEPHPCPVDADFFANDPGIMNSLYSARQFADSLGIPYKSYIFRMIDRLMGPGCYRRIPVPNQLHPPIGQRKRKGRKQYRTKSGVPVEHKVIRHGHVIKQELRERHDILDYDWDVRFMARNFVGDPAQERALQALLTHEGFGTPRGRLRDRLQKGNISPENALRVFPEKIARAAIEDVSVLPDISVADEELVPYRPHCLGLIQPQARATECMECPWNSKCEQLAKWAEGKQMAMTGYANRADRERQQARDRQRLSREHRKAGKARAEPGGEEDASGLSQPLI
jgi:hypothetical protein